MAPPIEGSNNNNNGFFSHSAHAADDALPIANHANIFRERQLLFFLIRYGFDAEEERGKKNKIGNKAKCKDEVFVPTEVKKVLFLFLLCRLQQSFTSFSPLLLLGNLVCFRQSQKNCLANCRRRTHF